MKTGTAEGSFALLKCGLPGTFHRVGEQHLRRYATEFDYGWNLRKASDSEVAGALLSQIGGKRLMYWDSLNG